MWHSRLFWRLFGTFTGLIVASTGFLGVSVIARVERHYLRQMEDNLRTKAVLLREVVRDRPAEGGHALQARVRTLREEVDTRITLLDADGIVLADSDEDPARMEPHDSRPEIRAARAKGIGTASRWSDTVGQTLMYVALRTGEGSHPIAFVRVALPLGQIEGQLAELRRMIWTATGVIFLAALGMAFWLSRSVAQPLHEIIAGAERLAAGEYGYKVYAVGQDEMGTLGRAFNHMSERLTAQVVQLREDHEQLRTILSGMVEGVIALDAQQRILFANDRAAQLLTFPNRTVVGRKLWEVVRHRGLQQVVERAVAGSGPDREEVPWEASGRSLAVYAAPLPGIPPRGAVVVLHDTTELRRLERLRQDFVANVSHELKTPLAVIKACVETLLDGAAEDPGPRDTFLKQVADQADRLHALILDLLSLARIESGTEAFEFEPIELETAITACLERHRTRAEAKKQVLEAVVAPVPRANGAVANGQAGPGVTAWADEEAVDQILENLVDNALKYTPEGGRIWVRARAEGQEVCLEVEDTGIGIPAADLPRIFERFYRVDRARSRELGGTGLGLSIVKHLAQAMHGSVEAVSQTGRGTRFTVCLPRRPDD
jgi:two-component system phosphate regulon sensor histidine kinase PhoR